MENVLFFETIIQPKGNNIIAIISVLILIIILVGLIILLPAVFYSMRNTSLSLTNKEIIIKSAIYGKKIPLKNVIIDGIKKINMNEDNEYNISIRTNGIGLPNFKLGWMRLKNGKKALVYLTDRNSVVLIPTNEYLILFSMENIDEFIQKIKETN
ncbi:MAG: PH domain-containing protein [Spirochaetaceae bacterium]|jgi:hypothetical protein|nr:PH domain-containing protein [Spirochaetaceae bacterium]